MISCHSAILTIFVCGIYVTENAGLDGELFSVIGQYQLNAVALSASIDAVPKKKYSAE